jgi:hypothetical protein
VLHEGQYERLQPDANGRLRSEVFADLWLDPTALLRNDLAAILTTLQGGLTGPEHTDFVACLTSDAQGAQLDDLKQDKNADEIVNK